MRFWAFMLPMGILALFASTAYGEMPLPPYKNGAPVMPDSLLLAERFVSWSYPISPSPNPTSIGNRSPTPDEVLVIERAHALLAATSAKAIALIDGPDIVYVEYKAPASERSLF